MLIPNLVPAFPEIFLALVIMTLLMFGVLQKTPNIEKDAKVAKMTAWLTVASL